MTSWVATILLAAVIALSGYVLLNPDSRPTLGDRSKSRTTRSTRVRFDTPGPIIASRVDNLDLDGLTIIPITHLPPIKLHVPLLSSRYALHCSLDVTSSEMAFTILRIATSSFKARDANREPLGINASGLTVKMSGNTGIRARIRLCKSQRTDGNKDTAVKEWNFRSSGRTQVELHDANLDIQLQLVQSPMGGPQVAVLSTSLKTGVIDRLHLHGFYPFGRFITFIIPYIRSTPLVSYPVGVIADYLIREAVEGRPVDEILAKFSHFATKHIDAEHYGAIVDADREAESKTPLDPNSLVPPPRATAESTTVRTTSGNIDDSAPSHAQRPLTTPFRFHAHLIGPTKLHSFRLPDFSPDLYRANGKGLRNTLQSLNLLTSEFKLQISNSALQSITFENASVAFDPPPNSPGIRGGDLVITVAPFACILVSSFSLSADVKNPLFSWTTGLDKLGEKGTSSTTVRSNTLQIRLKLSKARPGRVGAPIVLGVEEEVAALGVNGGRNEAKALSISDFSSIESKVELGSKLGKKLGEKVVNKLLEGLKTQLAQAASIIVAHFIVDLARDRLQQVLDEVDEKLRVEGGVEWGKAPDPPPQPFAETTGESRRTAGRQEL